jgi:hypothetical protein
MGRVVHFEIGADSVDRATRFYAEAFGWDHQEWDGPTEYRFLLTGPEDRQGIHGAVVEREAASGAPVVLTVEVGSLPDTVERVQGAGGRVLDAGHAIPGLGTLGLIEDTEGNRFAVLERAGAGTE